MHENRRCSFRDSASKLNSGKPCPPSSREMCSNLRGKLSMLLVVVMRTLSIIVSMDSSSEWLRTEFSALYTIELMMETLSTPIFAAYEKLFRERRHCTATVALFLSHSRVLDPELSASYMPPRNSIAPEVCAGTSCGVHPEE